MKDNLCNRNLIDNSTMKRKSRIQFARFLCTEFAYRMHLFEHIVIAGRLR